MTELLFRADPYLRDCEARVVAVNERGGVILDRTVFYATAGGQPGDTGTLEVPGMGALPIAATVYDDGKEIVHVIGDGGAHRFRVAFAVRGKHEAGLHYFQHMLQLVVILGYQRIGG